MPKRIKQPKKRSSDINQIAHQLVALSTEATQDNPAPAPDPSIISQYMAKIGSKGGKIGGKRRLKTMTEEERRKVAQKAAKARWNKAKRNS